MQVKFIDLNQQYKNIKIEIDEAINRVIKDSTFIGGPEIKEFERNFSDLIGTEFAVSCGNGTDALYIAMKSLGLNEGDEVITTSHSWIATSEAITQNRAKPVFVDTDKSSFCIDYKLIEAKINSKTVGIVPVHLYGHPCNMTEILRIAEKYKLWIVEDCAQAHLAEFEGKKVGNFGDLATFSFYPGKNLGAMGDAGCVLTNSKLHAEWCRKFANHGGKGKHEMEGINSRMDGMQAAILNKKLKFLKKWTNLRIEKANFYNYHLGKIKHLKTPHVHPNCKHVYHLYTIKTNFRDELRDFLNSKGIQTKINYPSILPCLPAYDYLGESNINFSNSYEYQSQILSLPLYPEITIEQQEYVIENISYFFDSFN